jgi:copper(I)-binding protein
MVAIIMLMALSVAFVAVACGGDDDDDDGNGGSTPAVTDGAKLGDLTISGQWVRTTTNNVTAAYLVVKNSGAADTLVKVTSPLTSNVQLHEVITEGSTSRMQEKPGGFPVPANGTLELKPGGFHIMMMDVEKPVTEGQEVSLTLTFEKAGDVTIVAVAKPGSDSGMGMDMGNGMATATPMR